MLPIATHLVGHSKVLKGDPNSLDKWAKAGAKQSNICINVTLMSANSLECKACTLVVIRFPGVHSEEYEQEVQTTCFPRGQNFNHDELPPMTQWATYGN